jgi:aspartate/methionine/tyrosine aminotransferase
MITKNDLNKHLLVAEYAVRGPIVSRAQQLEEQGRKIIYCNVGNPQALKQRPLTFVRQVLSLLEYPELLTKPDVLRSYPRDLVERAKMILAKHPHGTGAYSQSAGIPFIKQAVADFIAKRDGIPTVRDRIILTDGASKGVQAVLTALLKTPNDGFMIPIPQYPLYSASIVLYGGKCIGYYLDEENRWQLNIEILEESISSAKKEGVNSVAIAVINPGNPTGAVLSYDNIKMIIQFARKHRLTIMADEVYQENVYAKGAKFYSFAKVMHDLGDNETSLFSFHSVSKGFLGECGHRGGYMEMRNIPDDVAAEFIKLQSISLCSNVAGQITTYLMVSPPKPGDESYETYVSERDGVLNTLKRKAEILGEGINKISGMKLDIPEGAMYGFVKFELPPDPSVDVDAMTPAERLEYEAKRDSDYCMALLEKTGICVVPGSGFGQMPGTLHFRTTFLPPENEIRELVVSLKEFHESYSKELVTA